jgi:hypothetical protein
MFVGLACRVFLQAIKAFIHQILGFVEDIRINHPDAPSNSLRMSLLHNWPDGIMPKNVILAASNQALSMMRVFYRETVFLKVVLNFSVLFLLISATWAGTSAVDLVQPKGAMNTTNEMYAINATTPENMSQSNAQNISIAGPSGIWSEDIRLTDVQSPSFHPSIAVDSNDNVHVVWIGELIDFGCIYYLKLDKNGNRLIDKKKIGGLTLVDTRSKNEADSYGCPRICVDKNDNINIVYVDFTDYSISQGDLQTKSIIYKKLNSAGDEMAFKTIKRGALLRSPDIAADSIGNIYIVWEGYADPLPPNGDNSETYYAKVSKDGNVLKSERLTYDGEESKSGYPRIAIDYLDNVHIMWANGASVHYTVLDKSGNKLIDNRAELVGGSNPSIVSDSDSIRAIWNQLNFLYYEKLNSNGEVLVIPKKLLAVEVNKNLNPEVDSGPIDDLHLVWNQEDIGQPSSIYYMSLNKKDDVLISASKITFNNNINAHPDIAVDSMDCVHVVWTKGINENSEIHYTNLCPVLPCNPTVEIASIIPAEGTVLTPGQVVDFTVKVDYDLDCNDYGKIQLAVNKFTVAGTDQEFWINPGNPKKGSHTFTISKEIGKNWDHCYVSVTLYAAIENTPLPAGYSAFDYREFPITSRPPNRPNKPSGPASGYKWANYYYFTSARDPDRDMVKYTFDWGDGTKSDSAYVKSGTRGKASHIWSAIGSYQITATATDIKGVSSDSSNAFIVNIIQNNPPNSATIPVGPATGRIKKPYRYSASATDPDGDKVTLTFDWGDGTSSVTGLTKSGKSTKATHKWIKTGSYQVKVIATDRIGASSVLWSDPLTVTIT